MKRWHVVELVPARVSASIIPHTVTAPAVVDSKFVEVIAPVSYTVLFEHFLCQIREVAGIVCTVAAAIDQEHIELFSVVMKDVLTGKLNKLPAGAGTLQAFCRRILPIVDVSADCTFPRVTWLEIVRSGFPLCNKRHTGNSPLPVQGIQDTDTPVLW